MNKLVVCVVAWWVAMVAGCGDQWLVEGERSPVADIDDDGDDSITSHPDGFLSTLDVTPRTATLRVGATEQLLALGTMDGGVVADVTAGAAWVSSDKTIATVDDGVVTGHATGSVTMTARMGGMYASATITVLAPGASLVAISVSAPNPTLPAGASMPYAATGTYSDGSHADLTGSATWSVSPTTVATISPDGVATGVAIGAAVVKAQQDGVFGTVPLVVTSASLSRLVIDPAALSIAAGFRQQATATAVYSDGSSLDVTLLAQWSTSSTATAGVLLGNVHAHAVGSTTLTAQFAGLTGTAPVTVTAATLASIEISPAVISVGVGADVQLTATGVFSDGTHTDLTSQVTWSSAALGTASVSTSGKVTTSGIGVALITATKGALTDSVLVAVTAAQLTQIQLPAVLSLPVGRWFDLLPFGVFSDGITQLLTSGISFTSSNSAIASVSANGRITANAAGEVDITVTSGLISAVIHVTITQVTLSSVIVTPIAVVVTTGASVQMTATATYSDGSVMDVTAQGAWATASPAQATVSNAAATRGRLTGVAAGATAVSVVVDGMTASAPVVVSPALLSDLIVTPPALVLPRGFEAPLVAIGHYSDDSILDLTSQVTWSSSNDAVASVANTGLGMIGRVIAKSAGTATITATKGSVSKSVTVTVTAAILQSIELPTVPLVIPRGLTLPVIAIGVYSDGSHVDITGTVDWTSSAPAVASVSNLIGAVGVVTGNTVGAATITATKGGVSQTIPVTVTAALLQSIQLPTVPLTVPRGLTLPVIATGLYSDGSLADITATVTWSSSAPAIASVSNLLGAIGIVTGNSVGTATLTATKDGKSATVTVNVTAAILEAIQLPTVPVTVPRGMTLPVIAMGQYSDGSLVDITSSVMWSSSAPSVATVSSLLGSIGLVTGVNVGAATLTASKDGKSATIPVTVTTAVLSAIQLPTGPLSVPRGLTLPIIATGLYSDGSLATITSSVTWSTSAPSTATVSGLVLTAGLVSGVNVGTATITAQLGGKSATITVNVTPAILDSILVTTPSLLGILQLGAASAQGHYSDGTTLDISANVTWGSSNPLVATVGVGGSLLGLGLGSTTITATLGALTGQGNTGVGGAGTCHLVINEVKLGALLSSTNEFVEIHNPCSFPVDLANIRVVYRNLLDSTDTVLASPTGTIAPGGFRLYTGATYQGAGASDGSYATDMGLGGVGIRVIATGALMDSVAFAVSTNGLGEGILLGALPLGGSFGRVNGVDTDANLVDFVLDLTPSPGSAN